MRIIGGVKAGTTLITPKGQSVRPTLDRVREAIFNRLAPILPGSHVLDLFSGTGALGLESLSRGATSVTSIELSNKHLSYIRRNSQACGFQSPQLQLRQGCVFKVLRELAGQRAAFDIIMADPPFGDKTQGNRSHSLAQKLVDDDNLHALCNDSALFVLGHASRDQITLDAEWTVEKKQRYGDATINFLRRNPPNTV